MIKQQPAFYCIQLNELNILSDTLMLYYLSNGGENTASAEKLSEQLLVRVLYLMMGCSSVEYILNGMRIIINGILCEHLVQKISTS